MTTSNYTKIEGSTALVDGTSLAESAETEPAPAESEAPHMTIRVSYRPEDLAAWTAFLTGKEGKIGDREFSGYWLYCALHDPVLGWLCCEDDGHEIRDLATATDPPGKEEFEQILSDWKAGNDLPDGWFRVDPMVARLAWAEGVKLDGEDWYSFADGEGPAIDQILQRTLLGEVRYG